MVRAIEQKKIIKNLTQNFNEFRKYNILLKRDFFISLLPSDWLLNNTYIPFLWFLVLQRLCTFNLLVEKVLYTVIS